MATDVAILRFFVHAILALHAVSSVGAFTPLNLAFRSQQYGLCHRMRSHASKKRQSWRVLRAETEASATTNESSIPSPLVMAKFALPTLAMRLATPVKRYL
jgi:hypothetical protein